MPQIKSIIVTRPGLATRDPGPCLRAARTGATEAGTTLSRDKGMRIAGAGAFTPLEVIE